MHLKVRLSRRWGLFYTHSYQYLHYTDAEGEMNRSRTLAVTPSISLLSGTAAGEATEPELVRGPDEQVTAYFREHSGAVYRYLAGVYGRESDAEEVTQEAFLRLHLALVGREKIENPKAWVLTVARRLMLDRLKRGRCEAVRHCTVAPDVAESVCDPAPTPEEALAERRKRAALQHAVRNLTSLEQQCLFARAEGLKLRQIGEVVGMDLRRVAEVVERAVRTLQRQMRA
jgi:RNA polymerase sigma-70 factor (ECF subfamily)